MTSSPIPSPDQVRALQQELAAAGIPTVVGGSALLASLGVETEMHDWDLVSDASPQAVGDALERLGLTHARKGPSGIFRSGALFGIRHREGPVDLIVGFAIATPSGPVRIPAAPGGTWLGLRMARPEEWILAYRLMGRPRKAEALRRASGRSPRARDDD